jgi:monoamine oxidase
MKRMNYSSITSAIRRIHEAKRRSDDSGIPVRELLEQDRELRRKLLQEREQQKQRRDFLKAAGGLGLGAAMMPFTQNAFAAPAGGSQPEIAIVGAGAGGLRTAHRLMQYGIGSKIYEAGDRVGGRMYSDNSFFSDNRVVEYGGEFISTEHTAVRNLAHQLNLQLEDVNKLSLGDEETYLVEGELYTEADLMDEWVGGLYDIMKRAQQDAPWQPMYNTLHTDKHIEYDYKDAIDWMTEIGYPSHHWVHKLLLADLIAEYGITVGNSALNLIYLLGWNTHNSGGLPLAGTDERLHVVGGNDLIMHGMADQLPAGSIEMEKKLVAIDGTIKAPGGPYTLHFDDRSSATCDVLVMALPMNLIKNIEIDPNISTAFGEKKQMAFDSTSTVSDNGKIMLEFSNRFWDRTQVTSLFHRRRNGGRLLRLYLDLGRRARQPVAARGHGQLQRRLRSPKSHQQEYSWRCAPQGCPALPAAGGTNLGSGSGYCQHVHRQGAGVELDRRPPGQGRIHLAGRRRDDHLVGRAMGNRGRHLLRRRSLRRRVLVVHERRDPVGRARGAGNSAELLS